MRVRLGVLASHPVQYQAPLFRELARRLDLVVFFAHRQTPSGQAQAGFGVEFEWDVDLLAGYQHHFLRNVAPRPDVSRFSGCDTPELAKEIPAGHFDGFLVMGWYLKAHWQAVRACRRARVPVLVRGDSQLAGAGSPLRRVARELVHRWLVRQFDAFLYVGQRNREYLEHFGVRASKLFFSPHCVDTEWFRERAKAARGQRAELRTALGCSKGEALVVFVGKLIEKKRPLDLVEAAALLAREGCRVRVAFVGSGPLDDTLRTRAGRAGASVVLVGFRNQSQLPPLYAAADALVLPSDARETWGLVVNEAMSCGLPAVVSEAVGCAPDLVEAGVTGEVFRCGKVDDLARALARCLQRPRTEDLERALEERMTRYSVAAAAGGIQQALASVVGGKR